MFFGIFVLNRVSNLSFFVLIRQPRSQGLFPGNEVVNQGIDLSIFVLNRMSFLGRLTAEFLQALVN